mmetsp:Transcript_17354/g.44882  ORF Transcript_17354/g.44882 Transcript_17354/m.44882 type:complete len:217 (+) Transcript_17354:41-691(+)
MTTRAIAFLGALALPFAPVNCLRAAQARAQPVGRRTALAAAGSACCAAALGVAPQAALARPEGVNKPELLPKEKVNVIDLEGWLTKSERARLEKIIASLEKETQFKLRVLTQQYPRTPGLAIKDYWAIDDSTVVMVGDLGIDGKMRANVLNFNVGVAVPLPTAFWSRLQSKYGNTFYVKDQGRDAAVLSAAEAISDCLRRGEPYCAAPPKSAGELL